MPLFTKCCCFCSVANLHPTLRNPVDCSTPGFSVLHYLPEFAQTCVHWVGDTIQPSHPLSFPSPPALKLSQRQVFTKEMALRIKWPKYWTFSFSISPSNEYSGLISFRTDCLDLLAIQGTLNTNPKVLVFSNTTVQKHQFFVAQFSLWSNSHIIHDYWKTTALNSESESEVVQSCPTLCNSMDCNLPCFSVHGIF